MQQSPDLDAHSSRNLRIQNLNPTHSTWSTRSASLLRSTQSSRYAAEERIDDAGERLADQFSSEQTSKPRIEEDEEISDDGEDLMAGAADYVDDEDMDDDSQDDEEDDGEDSEEEREALAATKAAAVRAQQTFRQKNGESVIFKAPTNEEVQGLKETGELFKSNVFKLQVCSFLLIRERSEVSSQYHSDRRAVSRGPTLIRQDLSARNHSSQTQGPIRLSPFNP